MNLIPNSVSSLAGRSSLKLQKNSPSILFGLGITAVIGGTVLACRATLQLSKTMGKLEEDLEAVKELHKLGTPEEVRRDTAYIYGKTAINICKLYGPAVIVSVAGIALLSKSHRQLVNRNNALMAAYSAVSTAYANYRDRVREVVGEEKELDIYHSARTELCDTDQGDLELKVVDPNTYSPYAKFFDESSANWQRDAELNRIFIQCQQNYFNQKLIAKGHVFLNEVYDALDIARTREGAVVGWVHKGDGDGYISFGIFEAFNSRFVNGMEQSILLDFNVDGVVYDKI